MRRVEVSLAVAAEVDGGLLGNGFGDVDRVPQAGQTQVGIVGRDRGAAVGAEHMVLPRWWMVLHGDLLVQGWFLSMLCDPWSDGVERRLV